MKTTENINGVNCKISYGSPAPHFPSFASKEALIHDMVKREVISKCANVEEEGLIVEIEESEFCNYIAPKKRKPANGKSITIKQKVLAAKDNLSAMKTTKELRDWAVCNGLDNRSAFPRFKAALLEIEVDYDAMSGKLKHDKAQELEAKITHEITLFTDAKASRKRFGICDKDGNPLWYGLFFDTDTDFNGEQSTGELAAAKKAVWLAAKIKETIGAPAVALNLITDADWLTYQDHPGQKGYALTQLCNKCSIKLNVQWISGSRNPADAFTVCTGYKKWSENDLTLLAEKI